MPTATDQLPILNIAAYKFAPLDHLPERRQLLRRFCREHELRGTILLTPEGINLFIAGRESGVRALLTLLRSDPLLADLYAKESLSADQPFSRMLVKIKREIIVFGLDGIDPVGEPSPHLAPGELKKWLDEGRDFHLLDVRNDYEVRVGTFDRAEAIGVDHFRDFPGAVQRLPEDWKGKPVVMFCTGGIRCEKAGPFMEQAGFEHVYQLHGGILQYFEDCGGAHYNGDCFVFDQRVALDPQLRQSDIQQCFACLEPLTAEDQQSEHYIPGECCPHCHQSTGEKQAQLAATLEAQIGQACNPLPGSTPYVNHRPLNVPQRFSGLALLDCLDQFHPHVGRANWAHHLANGHIQLTGEAQAADRVVVAGETYVHVLPDTVEPEVATDIRVLYVDEHLLVLHKPAPLPVHPCGRFNLNTLGKLLKRAMPGRHPRPAHRLDANTCGILVMTFSRDIARMLQPKFATAEIAKSYRARLVGHPEEDELTCSLAIDDASVDLGARETSADGKAACTRFKILSRLADGTSLAEVLPVSGRTHQIRLHAWELGYPILGDPCYLPERQRGETQTLSVDAPPMCLQAAQLRFPHPVTNEMLDFTAPVPDWFGA